MKCVSNIHVPLMMFSKMFGDLSHFQHYNLPSILFDDEININLMIFQSAGGIIELIIKPSLGFYRNRYFVAV